MSEETYRHWFGNNLRNFRQSASLTQEKLSEELGITAQHLSYLETGSRSPSFEVISKAAKVFGVTPADLLSEMGKANSSSRYKETATKISQLIKTVSKEDQDRILKMVSLACRINR